MRVLVTGATGFVGSNLVRRLLSEGYDVHVTTRPSSNRWRLKGIEDRMSNHVLDLRDKDVVRDLLWSVRPDVVFHLATYGGFTNQDITSEIIHSNVVAMDNLLSALSRISFSAFINVGSSSEYGPKDSPMCEDDHPQPTSFYGVSKLAATLWGQTYAHNLGLPVVTARIFSPYGPFDDQARLIPSVIRACLENRSLQLTPGNQERDYIFVDDVIDGVSAMFKARAIWGEVINFGSGKGYRVRDVLAQIVGKVNPTLTMEWGAISYRPGETMRWSADVTKAKTLLGWEPKTPLSEGLDRTIAWFRENEG